MKNKIVIISAALLLNSTMSFASLGQHQRDESESSYSRPTKKARGSPQVEQVKDVFVQADLEDLFISKAENALNKVGANNFMNALLFLFKDSDSAQISNYSNTLKKLSLRGFFKDLENEVTSNKAGEGFFSNAFTTTFKMKDLSALQGAVASNQHRIFFHETGLLLRLKPLQKQYSFSFYTKKASQTVAQGKANEITALFNDQKQKAEAFKLYLHKTNEGDVFAIPVPRDPVATVSLKNFVGDEQFEKIAPQSTGDLSQHLRWTLIGTLGHRELYRAPEFKQLALSRKEEAKPEVDFSSEEAFPSLGAKNAMVEATSPSAPKPTALAPASNAGDNFDSSDEDTSKEPRFNVKGPERSSSSSSSSLTNDEDNSNFAFSGTGTPEEEYCDTIYPTHANYGYIPPFIYNYYGYLVPNPYFPGWYQQPYQVAYEG